MTMILIHVGELSLKGRNRIDFERQLIRNIKQLLPTQSVQRQHGRMLLQVQQADPALLAQLALIPGIRNFSIAREADRTLESMCCIAEQVVREVLDGDAAGKTFRISARRSDKRFPLTSMDINREVGAYLQQRLNMVVHLDQPDVNVHIEVAENQSYIYTLKHQAIGGLPVRSSGRGVVLLSGGIDSPVAAYSMMKRGMEVVLVHCYNSSINRDFSKICDLARQLSRYHGRIKLYFVDLEAFQRHAIAIIPAKYRMIIYKRRMIREAVRIAGIERAQALVTGDSLGQVASQTLANIHAIYDASPLPLLSPLIAMDKEEIILLARRIGTYEISIEEYCDICAYLLDKHPETHARRSDIAKLESQLPPDEDIETPIRHEYFSQV